MEVVQARKERQARRERESELGQDQEAHAHQRVERDSLAATLERGVAEAAKHAREVAESDNQQTNWTYAEPSPAQAPPSFFPAGPSKLEAKKPSARSKSARAAKARGRGARTASRLSNASHGSVGTVDSADEMA